MSHTWKFLPIAALAVIGLFLVSGAFSQTPSARANIDDISASGGLFEGENEITITVQGEDDNGVVTVEVTGDGDDVDIDDAEVDDCDEDPNETAGGVTLDTAECDGDTNGDDYTLTFVLSLECEEGDEIEITASEDAGDMDEEDLTLECGDEPTPTVTATTTVGPAATINVSSSNNNLGCGATSIVTITVLDADGDPVAAGTNVNIAADRGSVSPASGVTTADGSVFVFYTAPNNQGGEATITAAAGSALGNTEIDVNCNTQPTQAPPPTTAPGGGGIQPPNTGDGGLSTSNSWHTFAGVALIVSSVIGTLAVIRPRA